MSRDGEDVNYESKESHRVWSGLLNKLHKVTKLRITGKCLQLHLANQKHSVGITDKGLQWFVILYTLSIFDFHS